LCFEAIYIARGLVAVS